MAFGKEPRNLSQTGSFRQVSTRFMQRPKPAEQRTGGGKNAIPYFVDMYVPSTDEIDLIRLVPGEYPQQQLVGEATNVTTEDVVMPYIRFTEHYHATLRKGAICSAGALAGYKDKREPCVGCDIFWDTVVRNSEGRVQSTTISRQNKFAISVFDYGTYHKVEQLDAQGHIKVNATTKEAYFNWQKCQGQGCEYCRTGKPTKAGQMSHWPLTYTQFGVLQSAEDNIGKMCSTCGSDNSIVSHGWMCANCGYEAVDMESTHLRKEELRKIVDYPYHCRCGHEGFLQELFECRVCTPQNKVAKRATLFDVDLRVQAVESPTQKGKTLQILGWSTPRAIDPQFAELAKPVDLLARYAPDTLERQEHKFGRQVATQDGPAAPATVPYSPAPRTVRY